MSLNSKLQSVRINIRLSDKINVDKSSVINSITNQKPVIVSRASGTTNPIFRPIEASPQQQVTRYILDYGTITFTTKENTPKHTLLTSFSILFARHKGNLNELVKVTYAVNNLKVRDKILATKGYTIVHFGACTLRRVYMLDKIDKTKDHNIPIVNYGILIAYLNGILDRMLEPLKILKSEKLLQLSI